MTTVHTSELHPNTAPALTLVKDGKAGEKKETNKVDSNEGGLGMQITAGPAALAAASFYAMMALYLMIISLEAKQTSTSYSMVGSEAQTQYNQTITSGQQQAQALTSQGVSTIVGGGLQAGFMAVDEYMSRSSSNQTANDLKETSAELEPLTKTNSQHLVDPSGNSVVGTDNTENLDSRMEDLKAGKFAKDADGQAKDVEALQKLRQNSAKADATEEDVAAYTKAKQQLDTKITNLTSREATLSKRLSDTSTKWQTVGNVANSLSQGAGNLGQASATVAKTQADANADINRTMVGMATNSAQTYASLIGKMYDTAVAAVQALKQLAAAGQTN